MIKNTSFFYLTKFYLSLSYKINFNLLIFLLFNNKGLFLYNFYKNLNFFIFNKKNNFNFELPFKSHFFYNYTINKITNFKNLNYLNKIILLKKKLSFFKKMEDFNYIILNKIKNNTDFKKNLKFKKSNFYINSNPSFKNLDLSKNIKRYIKINRQVLKKSYNYDFSTVKKFNKKLKKLTKINKKSLIINTNFNVINIIHRSNFFFNYNDIIWFYKNSLLLLNGYKLKNCKHILSLNDKINIVYSKIYFNFYKNSLQSIFNRSYKINFKFWFFNKSRSNNLNSIENYPTYLNNYKYFKNDLPLFLEVDYITLTIVIINYRIDILNFDYYSFKFLNFYTNRLYNWKYII